MRNLINENRPMHCLKKKMREEARYIRSGFVILTKRAILCIEIKR